MPHIHVLVADEELGRIEKIHSGSALEYEVSSSVNNTEEVEIKHMDQRMLQYEKDGIASDSEEVKARLHSRKC